MKRLFLFVVLTWGSHACSAEPSKTVEAAKNSLNEAGIVDLWFHGGFSGEPMAKSVALLFLLGEPDIAHYFAELTKKPGAPSVYGLIGLRHVNPKSDIYDKSLKLVVKRDGDRIVKIARGDVISSIKLSELLVEPEGRNSNKRLMFGEYCTDTLASVPQKDLTYVVDNGLLGEKILNPFMFLDTVSDERKSKLDKYDLQRVSFAEKVVAWKLLHRNPREVLRFVGFNEDKEILKYLTE